MSGGPRNGPPETSCRVWAIRAVSNGWRSGQIPVGFGGVTEAQAARATQWTVRCVVLNDVCGARL